MKFSIHLQLMFFVFVFFVINFSMFLGMWIQAWIWTGSSPSVSFSEMLAEDERVKEWYLSWWGMYTIVCLVLMFLMIWYMISCDFREDVRRSASIAKKFCYCSMSRTSCAYHVITYLYVPMTFLKLTALMLIVFYPVTTANRTHLIFASLAFSSAMACCLLLFIRRCLLIFALAQIHMYLSLFMVNLVTLVGQFVMGALFLTNYDGVFEFVLSLLIVWDIFYQIFDFYHDRHISKHLGLVNGSYT